MKVFVNNKSIHGIARVVEAQMKYLGEFGVEVVSDPKRADVIANHGAEAYEYGTTPLVSHNHGAYWSRQDWGRNYKEVNKQVVASMLRSVAHTAPSRWVAEALRRGAFIYPEVVYHGVNAEEFWQGDNKGYVLWNKARPDFVSDPRDLMEVAMNMPKTQFWTTIGHKTSNVKVIGVLPYTDMKEVLASAGVYLATTRETFGIGTLEALASGVPVAGWDWGGQSEIIKQGETGYLAPPGNWKALEECVQLCINQRDRLSPNCVDDAHDRWGWRQRIQQYADLYKRVYELYSRKAPKVSVIITAYKLDAYLPKCLRSVQAQSFEDFECIVVDDANLESTRTIVEHLVGNDNRFRYVATPHNLGLPGARNFGLSQSTGFYIRHLDADDFLAENALAVEAEALDKDNSIHIVYGHMGLVDPDGSVQMEGTEVKRPGWPEKQFDWYKQMAHLNQIPSCAMARREVYEKTGGYRERMERNEDAEFWCRATSLGFHASKVTQAITYYHMMRNDSKGAVEWREQGKEPDWTAWFPWRLGADDYATGKVAWKKYNRNHPAQHLVPFGAQGPPSEKDHFWLINDYAYPVVSVIVTCGPNHRQYLLDALDSVQAQSFTDWECIVVNNTGENWGRNLMGAPWAKIVDMGGNKGASAARNAGYRYARGKYIIWLDADDYWMPWLLEKMVAYAEHNEGVIYSDFIDTDDNKHFELHGHGEFAVERVLNDYCYAGSSVLYPRKIVQAVFDEYGGWDEKIPGKEDWDWQIAVHTLGYCAYRVPEGLFVYRRYTTTKRETDHAKIDEIVDYVNKKWYPYRTGEKRIMCGCNRKTIPRTTPSSTMSASGHFIKNTDEIAGAQTAVAVEYLGPLTGKFTIKSRVAPGISYRFSTTDRIKDVFIEDAKLLVSRLDAQGRPEYRILQGKIAPEDVNNPSAVLGAPVGV